MYVLWARAANLKFRGYILEGILPKVIIVEKPFLVQSMKNWLYCFLSGPVTVYTEQIIQATDLNEFHGFDNYLYKQHSLLVHSA